MGEVVGFVKTEPMKKTGLALFSVLLALAAGEIYLRLNPPLAIYNKTFHNLQETHSAPSPNPEIGYIPAANLNKPFTNREFRTVIQTNSFHMRGGEITFEKPAGTRRIVTVGDSFLFGWGVNNEDLLTRVLENKLDHTEVLNLGMSGYCASQQVERLKEEGLRFQPDIVLFFVNEFPEACTPELMLRDGKLQHPYENAGRRASLRIWALKHIYLYAMMEQVFYILFSSSNIKEDPAQEELIERKYQAEGVSVLEQLKEVRRGQSWILILVFAPNKEWLLGKSRLVAERLAIVKKIAGKENWKFLDLTRALEKKSEEGKFPYFKLDIHWNREGHEAAAEAIEAYLKQENLI